MIGMRTAFNFAAPLPDLRKIIMVVPAESRPETDQTRITSASSNVDETVTGSNAPTDSAPAVAPAFGPPAEPGEVGTLGPYRVVKELGHGGMGAVYAAIDTRLDRRLALKVMLPKFAADASARERFLREARAAAKISHDNVVTVYEADERDGVPYIAMQYLEGYSLDAFLKRKGNPTVAQVLRIAAEAAAGLAAAHKIGLIHRDIKPGNLWLEAPNGRVKILDFGLARPVDANIELTRSGVLVGTPAYMSPEQARAEKLDGRTDLFSLGAVLYRLCTGRLPFDGASTMAVLMALGTEDPIPVLQLNPEVPEALAALIQQLLSKRVDARPANADEVLRRLSLIAGDLAVPLASAVDDATAPPQRVEYVPIQVTALSEADPFADIDVADTEMTEHAAPMQVRTRSDGRGLWLIAGFAAMLAVAAIVIIIKNKDGTETKIEVPDGSTVTVFPPKGKPIQVPPIPVDPERAAAEWAIAQGGIVRVSDEARDIKVVADLPKGRLTLTYLYLYGKPITDEGLVHFKDCTGLKHLHLGGSNARISDEGLAHFKNCKGLTTLIPSLNRDPVKGTALAHFKELTILNLTNTPVTDEALIHIKDCKWLKHLDLSGTKITHEALAGLKAFKLLSNLGLSETLITNAALIHLKDLAGLSRLALNKTPITDEGLSHLKECKTLTFLNVRQTKVTRKGLDEFHAAVPRCKIEHDNGTLEPKAPADPDRTAAEYVLSLGGIVAVNGQVRDIRELARLPKERFTLTYVNLKSKPITDEGLENLRHCKGLTLLDLAGTPVTDAGLANLENCRELRFLNLSFTNVTEEGLAAFKGCAELSELYLRDTAVTDAGLAHFKACKKLTVIHLGNATAITDAGLESFKDCKALTQLHLSSTRLNGEGLVHFKDCKELKVLVLSYSTVNDAGLTHFKDCKRLSNLQLAAMPKVTEEGLANFKDCRELTDLTLQRTPATDEGLFHFKECKGLTLVTVKETKVSEKGMAEFHAAVPGCRILHDAGAIEPKK